jgi:hypothetical protein
MGGRELGIVKNARKLNRPKSFAGTELRQKLDRLPIVGTMKSAGQQSHTIGRHDNDNLPCNVSRIGYGKN